MHTSMLKLKPKGVLMKRDLSRITGKTRNGLGAGVSHFCLAAGLMLFAGNAHAQSADPVEDAPVVEQADTITVTGSRVLRNGYDAPTPTTVLSMEELGASAPTNIADVVNHLPALGTSLNPTTQGGQISNGATGINSLNLRDLGTARTLILFDGKRVPAATLTGLVDVNFIPDALVKRVDVVTGGASAAWGSDAVAGVVNFVLDKEFKGIKGSATGGITTFGDNENYKFTLSAGTRFADGRGHVMVSGQMSYADGIQGYPRKWYTGSKLIANPAYATDKSQPYYLVARDVGFTTAAPGAIVSAGPLRGLYFGPGGTPAQLNFGSIVSDPFMVGGDWKYTDFGDAPQDLEPMISRQSVSGFASFEITDNIEVYAHGMYSRAFTSMESTPEFRFGTLNIQKDNAFLPTSVVDRMTAANVTTLRVGTWNEDYGGVLTETKREQQRYVFGFRGKFGAFGSDWQYDAYASHNVSNILNSAYPTITANFNQAIDAVRNSNGAIVCRTTLTNPNNGCVPYNLLGTGVASEAAKDYVRGNTWVRAKLTQNVFAASMNGTPFSTWAGPVSVAFGLEHRSEKIDSTTDPLSKNNAYWAGNYKALTGSFTVTEAFLETVIPLIEEKLDANLAVRGTDYSSSGYVTTWKAGMNFSPIRDVRFRVTRSRDIRAGNLSELYAAGQAATSSINDPFNNNLPTSYFQITSGNQDLKPERADTLAAGVVFQPSFLPGLQGSVDFFDIKVKDAVATIAYGTILNECFKGDALLCSQITRDANNVITQIRRAPINFNRELVRGLDFELSYRTPLFGGNLTLRALATHYLKAELDNGVDAPNSSLGELRGGVPNWKYRLQGTYDHGPVSLTAVARGVSDGVYAVTYIECASNCPLTAAATTTINNNHIDGAFYVDLSARVKATRSVDLIFAVDNVANRAPSVAARGTSVGSAPLDTYGYYFDMVGRRFRIGARFGF
ncbi:MAG: TonB-dependent receptor [Sphingomonadales bacterium]|nr:MAG: TonB-dependent receptor [Sphingomonadales bacterium]